MRDRSVLQSSAQEALAECSESRRYTVFVGGFPCQDLSIAGKQKGRKGSRSGLYRDYLAVIAAERPSWIVTENVGHTWRRWVPHLRRSLHRLGYASLPLRVRASDLGAPHERTRIYLVAHADGELLRELSGWWCGTGRQMAYEFASNGGPEQVAYPASIRRYKEHSDCGGSSGGSSEGSREEGNNGSGFAFRSSLGDPHGEGLEIGESIRCDPRTQRQAVVGAGWWSVEPPLGRVVDGFPGRVDQLTALGNAIVPQIAEIIARGIRSIT